MTIEEAKQVRIVDFLAQLGHHAQYVKSDQYWYLSPLRDEQSPSFKVNDRLNEWYDFGAATGGDLVELGKYLYQTESVSEVLAYIGRHSSDMPLPKVRFQALPPRPVESDMKNLIVVPLRHHALYSYLQSRKIDADIGRMFCKEIIMNCVTGIILPSRSVMFRADMKCATPIIKDVSRTRTSP